MTGTPTAADARTLTVLVVEDESHLLTGLELNLALDGYKVHSARTLAEARAVIDSERIDCILLDLMLPDGSGLTFLSALRARKDFTPILILTAKGQPSDVVEGLEAGADDYLKKPFDLTELLSRVRVLLRRQRWEAEREVERSPSTIGAATVDWNTHELRRGHEVRRLTGLELKLIAHFLDHAGRTLTREALLREVWGLSGYQTRTVDNFLARMRKYFEEDASQPRHFLTVRGAGYRFEP